MIQLSQHAKRLRKDSTDAERLLWTRVRASRLEGHKFRRQQPIGPYIVDFVCFEAKLVVELDGGQHAQARGCGSHPRHVAVCQGFGVLRFWNNDVMQNLDGVLAQIMENLTRSAANAEGDAIA